jgi:hypothetical protein
MGIIIMAYGNKIQYKIREFNSEQGAALLIHTTNHPMNTTM